VYVRDLEIVGSEEFAREVTGRELPPGIHLSVEVEQQGSAGG
jgi:hypothetical protein